MLTRLRVRCDADQGVVLEDVHPEVKEFVSEKQLILIPHHDFPEEKGCCQSRGLTGGDADPAWKKFLSILRSKANLCFRDIMEWGDCPGNTSATAPANLRVGNQPEPRANKPNGPAAPQFHLGWFGAEESVTSSQEDSVVSAIALCNIGGKKTGTFVLYDGQVEHVRGSFTCDASDRLPGC